MEQPLLAASLRSREDHELISQYINMRLATYSKPFQIVMHKVGEYYKRDANVSHVDPSILLTQIAESIRNDKHVARFTELINESLATTGSDINVRAAILLAKQQEVGDQLSQALAQDAGGNAKIDELIEELRNLRSMTSLDELEGKGLESFANVDLASLIAREFDPEGLIALYPSSLNERLDGGARGGHHILVFAQVETGKSAVCINMDCGFARQGKKSLYIINEDRPEDIILRHIANLSGMTKYQIQENPRKAQDLAESAGWGNVTVINAEPGTPSQIEDAIELHDPDVVIVDQLRNLQVKAESRVNQLELAATSMRNIGKRTNKLVVSVTQAGDSANNKLTLDKGDVDFSNVGIPSQMDVMIGVGVDPTFEAEGLRNFSLCKNKISGRHENWPVRIIPQLSRIISV
jgi:archaellum biogenesis ATPase FlaH